MARLTRGISLLILLALALPLNAASKDSRADHHKSETAGPAEPIKQQESQVPLSVWQATETALSEAIQTVKQQSVAAEKQAETYKETWCSPSVLVNIALAIIGLGYLIFAGLQWKAIEKQATIAKDTLIAAKAGQRAQIVASVRRLVSGDPPAPRPIPGFEVGGRPLFIVDLRNINPTPAYDCSYETWIEVTDRPFKDFSSGAIYFKQIAKITIYPQSPVPVTVGIQLDRPLTRDEFTAITQSPNLLPDAIPTKWLCFRVYIQYRDAFNDSRYANFAYGYDGTGIEPLPKYNDSN